MTHTTPSTWLKWLIVGIAAQALPAWADGNVLEQLKVTPGPDDTRVVSVTLKDSPAAPPVTFTTASPNRIIVDFAKTKSGMGRHVETVNAGSIRTVQVLESGDRTRLVLSLDGPAQYEVKTERNQVVIAVRGAKAGAAAPTHFAETAPKRSHGIRDIDFRRGTSGEGRVVVRLTDPGIGIDIKQVGNKIQVDFLNTALPPGLARRLDVSDFATPAQSIETFAVNGHTRMVVTPAGKPSHSAYQTGDQFVLELAAQEAGFAVPGKREQYTGEKLTLDFYNVEVKDLLKVIADFTGLNIVTSEKVTGTISLRLKDIPWDQALDIILATKGMDKRVIGSNVIWVAPRSELAELDKRELEDRQKISELEELTTEAIRLNYLRADEAQAILSGQSVAATHASEAVTCTPAATGITGAPAQAMSASLPGQQGAAAAAAQRILSPRGSSSYDLKTNTLFVKDSAAKIKEIKEVLARVDTPARQVMIEARVVVANDGFSRDLGARLMLRGFGGIGGGGIGLGGTLGTETTDAIGFLNTRSVTNPSIPNVNLPFSTAESPPSTLGIAIVNSASTALVGLEIQALEADNRGKIISSPRVVTQNQKPAVILQGTQFPVVTPGTANNPATTTFKDALLCLLVNPQVLNNEEVILSVEVTKDVAGEVIAGTGGNRPINARRVKTQVRVKSGETAVLGGIFEQELRNDVSKVPLLGDLPVLGHLFKRTHKSDAKTELLIFLTPRVMPEGLAGLQ